jgi:hypothetical protein
MQIQVFIIAKWRSCTKYGYFSFGNIQIGNVISERSEQREALLVELA